VLVGVGEDDGGAGLGEGVGGGEAHSGAGAGDDGDLVAEVVGGIHRVFSVVLMCARCSEDFCATPSGSGVSAAAWRKRSATFAPHLSPGPLVVSHAAHMQRCPVEVDRCVARS
jgi:hypothetical protein